VVVGVEYELIEVVAVAVLVVIARTTHRLGLHHHQNYLVALVVGLLLKHLLLRHSELHIQLQSVLVELGQHPLLV
jgi:hypothetical protein